MCDGKTQSCAVEEAKQQVNWTEKLQMQKEAGLECKNEGRINPSLQIDDC